MNIIPDHRSMYRLIVSTFAVAIIGVFLFCGSSPAQDGASGQQAGPKPGDCMACHAGKQVLSEDHADTKDMTMKQCLICHGPEKIPLSEKFLAAHEKMLSGVSSVQKSGGAAVDGAGAKQAVSGDGGKAAASGAPAAVPDCTACHSKPEFGKFFSATSHGNLQCAACHKGVTDIPAHMQDPSKVQTASCETCHKGVVEQGLHAKVGGFSCRQCHPDIHPKEAPKTNAPKVKPAAAPAATSVMPSIAQCASCHSEPRYAEHFARSSHGSLSCTVCHQGITDMALHMKKEQKPTLASCASCHKDVEKEYGRSHHATEAKLSCQQCHSDVHSEQAAKGDDGKAEAAAVCLKCHSDQDRYVTNGHTAKVMAGNKDAASCTDCHGAHDTKTFDQTDKGRAEKRAYYTAVCTACHREGGVAGGHGVFPKAAEAFGQTYHGKAAKLGETDKVAGCADCHPAHNILPADEAASALSTAQLVETCGRCHEGFHPRFVSYVPHPDPHDKAGFLSLYLTEKFMVALLIGVFAFFWVHAFLWWRKVYAEKSRLIKAGLKVRTDLPQEQAGRYVRRFGLRERIMHIVLILSFFGVVISGFPIKYADAPWARALASVMGGVAGAALVHRISAAAMSLLFLYVCWRSVKFLFPGFEVRGWLGRLFGPDSLFPRLKDIQDCLGMFRWFFNKGDKPQFDRWTYWEKFDFMAVFWGMFVIGLSGLVMWIPEYASWVMPGWMINIVHLAHSEEAFLAAVFIFTVHFFNTHLVPDKFPLEKNIFTGSYTLEALKHERPVEYERIVRENRLEEISCEGPGTAVQLFAGAFGIACVLLGLALTALIFWAALA